ncbi:MAG TPA: ABC-F family ATP-binding cassette domain-containing protein [Candidatus Dormibacteraeota bacterium]|nr:ABC-F family ATP-binding cassette domain-containing protein [Candidatus Dormibacteraeota bacterium]
MELLRFTALECHYGAREIFSGVDAVLNQGERIGLVGPNGAGKSSLLRLLAGTEAPFGGSIVRAKDTRLGYLAQSVADETRATLQELVDSALARVPDTEWALQQKKLRAMLDGFGFTAADYERPLREFSGGQRAKAALAHLLIDDPDYLILDEPTNHLDIATVRWLESFIANDKRAYIIVSHDRYFLDRVATRIWELERGRFHVYAPAQPAYARYVEQRDVRIAAEREAYATFVAERDKRRATIAGLRATHTSSDYSQVRSREKQLARMEATLQAPEPTVGTVAINVRLDASRRASNGFAFEARGLAKRYAEPLFSDVTFDLKQGGRLAIVGPNGSGKSTLLKIISGELAADEGSVRFNPAVQVAYFAQSALDQLDVTVSAVDAVLQAAPILPEQARALLGRMRISGEAAEKPVGAFSGGERRRIMLARLMARDADLLLLDEPTNDLDIDSRDALEGVLDEYRGAVAIVSHDRYLLQRLSDQVLWIDGGEWGLIEGGYDAYEAMMREREANARGRGKADAAERGNGQSRRTPLKIRSQLTSKIARIEREIERLDERKAQIEAIFATVEVYADRAQVTALESELEELRERAAAAVTTWEHSLEELERL